MASKLPLPDVCTHGHDWSPIAAASNQSVIAGVLAGFLFAGIVVVLSQRTSRHQDSTRALKLMLTAFLGRRSPPICTPRSPGKKGSPARGDRGGPDAGASSAHAALRSSPR